MEEKKIEDRRGSFGIGIYQGKNTLNIGTLWRSAYIYGASFIFTVGERYKKQPSDTVNAVRHIPLFHFDSLEEFTKAIPENFDLICVGMVDTQKDMLGRFNHPDSAIYLLGAEDYGLPEEFLKGKRKLQIPSIREYSLNVAVAGSIVLYDRYVNRDISKLLKGK